MPSHSKCAGINKKKSFENWMNPTKAHKIHWTNKIGFAIFFNYGFCHNELRPSSVNMATYYLLNLKSILGVNQFQCTSNNIAFLFISIQKATIMCPMWWPLQMEQPYFSSMTMNTWYIAREVQSFIGVAGCTTLDALHLFQHAWSMEL